MATVLNSPAPAGSLNVQQFPDGTWTWTNPDGSTSYVLPEKTDPKTGATLPGDTYTLLPGQSVTDPNAFGGYTAATGYPEEEDTTDQALLDVLLGFLTQYGLEALLPWVEQVISEGWSYNQILLELRKQPAYLEAFPENSIRDANGYSFMPEDQILAYRNEAKRIAQSWGYDNVTDQDIANLIGANISVSEFEHRLEVMNQVQEYGDFVKNYFETLIGYDLDDEELFEFFDPEISTAELDRAYEDARYTQQPVLLGLTARSQEDAEWFRAMGIDPDEAFARFEQVALNSDRYTRLSTIESAITDGLPDNFGTHLQDVTNETLIQGLVFQDAAALEQLQAMTAREIGRLKSGGGMAGSGTQAIGALTPDQRQNL